MIILSIRHVSCYIEVNIIYIKFLLHLKNITEITISIFFRFAGKDLLSFSFSFGVFFFAFTMFGQAVFGPYIEDYSNFMTSLETHFRFALGQYDFRGMINANLLLGAIYFVSFILIVIMGLVSMFCAILCEAFEKVKEDMTKQKNDYEMLNMISGAIKKITGKNKGRNKKSGKISAIDDGSKDTVSSLNVTSLSVTVKEPVEYTPLSLSNPKNQLNRRPPPLKADSFTNIIYE